MARIAYIEKNFKPRTLEVIEQANTICADFRRRGYDLTLRQLYYQFVSRDLIPNRDSEYKKLGEIVNDARLAGLMDWDYIIDRTRHLRSNSHWSNPSEIIQSAAQSFAMDKWRDQSNYVEVWIEKDALVGVIEGVCREEDVSFFSCRGYTSQSEVWSAAQRHKRQIQRGKRTHIIHLGDHDPSGIDMTRDIFDRLSLFLGHSGLMAPEVHRIALNMDQIETYGPPPNPAKLTDSRAKDYVKAYGDDSWELDALDPDVIVDLVRSEIDDISDILIWDRTVRRENEGRRLLDAAATRWGEVAAFLAES